MKQVHKTHKKTTRDAAREHHAQHRKRKRKRKYMLYYILLFVIVISTAIALSMTVLFHIENVEAENTGAYTAEEVIGYSGVQVGDNLLRTNTGRARENILNNCLYLDEVTLVRSFPSTVRIECTPATPAYSYQMPEGFLYVSESGRILEVAQPEAAPNTFTISGFDIENPQQGAFITAQNQESLKKLELLQTQVQQAGIEGVTGIALTEDGANITYQNRIVIEISDLNNAQYILDASKKILDSYIGTQEKGTIFYVESNQSIHFLPDVET